MSCETQAATIYGACVERHRDTVHLVVTTEFGRGLLRISPKLAKSIGRELALKATEPVGQHHPPPTLAQIAAHGQPLPKPGGALL